MKAFVVRRYGGPVVPDELPEPSAGPGDVVVDVRAASVNPLDSMLRRGDLKQVLSYRPPFALGHDLAGVVVAVGAGVSAFSVGDEVIARVRDGRIGTFAERIAVDAADLAPKPSSLTMAEAGAVPLVALAAWQVLVEVADVQPGQRVLVHGGAGGLGSTVIQVAKHLGAHVATTVSTRDVVKARELGADEVVDYTAATDFADVLAGYDVVVDSVGGETLLRSMTVMRPGGIAVSVVGPPDPAFARSAGRPLLAPVMALLSRGVRRQARRHRVRYAFWFMRADGARLAELGRLYDAGVLRPVLDRTFAFEDTVDAVEHVEQGRARGKVVITRRQDPGT
ncbi:NADPH:quinone reductase [Nocardioides exalbidus]|uniref:NADPH:quinone reductase n=1 Tax=Nocardioides exalbidus TaxID=402596 RepID=A0A1H4NDV3_9ACTN|nr:NADP-dependent oxidoreductase [Nocardioides exalbidus]SEB92792.1 NADPH:quinone reductase [Nocardioides exalbidus]